VYKTTDVINATNGAKEGVGEVAKYPNTLDRIRNAGLG
jgi:hypothetical protein